MYNDVIKITKKFFSKPVDDSGVFLYLLPCVEAEYASKHNRKQLRSP
jgi:hypothetical protein